MTYVEIFFLCVAGALLCLAVFMILRTATVRPESPPVDGERGICEFDFEKIAAHLSEAVKIPTVSVADEEGDYAPFDEFRAFLERTYPAVFGIGEKTAINGYSLIVKIPGSDEKLLPACFLSHQDVVPAPEKGWDYPPFGGEIRDGFVCGRGSLDMKGHMIALLEGLERILEEKKRPERTIYLCFGHDEELMGRNGAGKIVEYLSEKGVRMEYVVDEGGIIADGGTLGIDGKLALIGTCEKGYADFVLTSAKDGGHASSPDKSGAVGALAKAICRLSRRPMKAYWSEPLKATLRYLTPHMRFPYRFLFANRDILGPLLKAILCKAGPTTNSVMRTTFAFTQIAGSDAPNVIPSEASAVVNVRINIGCTKEEVGKYIQKRVGKDIEVRELNVGFDPSPQSSVESGAYKALTRTISEVFGDYIPVPYPFIAAADAKYYHKISDCVYRFCPLEMREEDRCRIHGVNEKCSIESCRGAARFFAGFIENTCYGKRTGKFSKKFFP